MGQTVTEQKKLPGKQKRTEARIQRDIAIYQSHMRGNSVRAICDEFQIKSTQTIWGAINRGRQHVIDQGIDHEVRRIEIDEMFKNTLGHLAGEIQRQADEGRIVEIERNDGSKEIRRTRGIDPRTAEALARSADRWAQFLGVTDRATEVNQQATVINLSAPTDGAAFADKWNSTETVDVTPSESKSESNAHVIVGNAIAEQEGPTARKAVESPERTQQELF